MLLGQPVGTIPLASSWLSVRPAFVVYRDANGRGLLCGGVGLGGMMPDSSGKLNRGFVTEVDPGRHEGCGKRRCRPPSALSVGAG